MTTAGDARERPKLNLGSGHRPMPGWISVDHHMPADQDVDLFRFPWPWRDNEVAAVAMFHLLEHFDPDGVVRVIREVHRILQPGGFWWIKVPHGRGTSACGLGHKTFFTYATFRALYTADCWFLLPGHCRFTNDYFRFRLLCFKDRLEWTPLDWLISKMPQLYEKLGVFPPAEIEWRGRAIKSAGG